jgi:mRNA interferase RelE/StbE
VAYELEFHAAALKEWQNLDNSVRLFLRKKLEKRLENPRIDSARLHGDLQHCYKIKSDKTGHRLVYQVIDDQIIVYVIAVDKRDDLMAYRLAVQRINN